MAELLPDAIVQAIAISNAKSIGEQPAILANLALAQQVFKQSLEQQATLGRQQALNYVQLAATAKSIATINKGDAGAGQAVLGPLTEPIDKTRYGIVLLPLS